MKKVHFPNSYLKFIKKINFNSYVFEGSKDLNKLEIKEYFKKIYEVSPKKINVLNSRNLKRASRKYKSVTKIVFNKKIVVSF